MIAKISETDAMLVERACHQALAVAAKAMSEDYQTSENHHPAHVLVPLEAFNALRAALAEEPISAAKPECPIRKAFFAGWSARVDDLSQLPHEWCEQEYTAWRLAAL